MKEKLLAKQATAPTIDVRDALERSVEDFLADTDIRENSRTTYRRALRSFLAYLLDQKEGQPTRETILAYKSEVAKRGLSALTINAYLVAVRRWFAWLESKKVYPNIARNIRGARRRRGFGKEPLTAEQARAILDMVDVSTLQGKRDYAILNLMLRTGLRTIEVVRANVEDLRQESGQPVLYVHGKGRDTKDEFVLLTPEALGPIHDYLAARGKVQEGNPLFAGTGNRNRNGRLTTARIRGMVKAMLRKVHLNSRRFSAHSLRHTFATLALRGGAPVEQVQAACRHASIDTTMVYVHVLDRLSNGAEKYIAL